MTQARSSGGPCRFAFCWLLAVGATLPAQGPTTRPLTHDDYDQWKSLRGTAYSRDGHWVAYAVQPQWGDGELIVREAAGGAVHRHARGAGPAFSHDSGWVAFKIEPSAVEERAERLAELREKGEPPKKKKDDDNPADLGLINLSSGALETVPRIKGFDVADELPFVAYHLAAPKKDKDDEEGDDEAEAEEGESKEPTAKEPTEKESGDKKKDKKKRKDGTALVLRDLRSGAERRFEHVVSYGLSEKGRWLWFHCSTKDESGKDDWGLHAVRVEGGDRVTLLAGEGAFDGVTMDEEETALAFTSTAEDHAADEPRRDLYLWDLSSPAARRVAGPKTPGMPAGKHVAKNGLSFAKDGSVLRFGIQDHEPKPREVLPEDKVVLDLWHWDDGVIQPAQAKRKDRLDNPAWTCVWHLDDARMVVLGDTEVPSARLITPDGSRALASDTTPYEKRETWDGSYRDVYLINTLTGARQRILEETRSRVQSSPDGRWLAWFGSEGDYQWHVLDVLSLAIHTPSDNLPVHFEREDDDRPAPDPSYGIAGWTEGETGVVVYDEFDLWHFPLTEPTAAPVCVTDGLGRERKIRFRVVRLDEDADHLSTELWLSAFDTESMAEGFYCDSLQEIGKPEQRFWREQNVGRLTKAEDADRLYFTLETFAQFPDLWTCNLDFTELRRLSDANPQQAEFRWGKAEQVRWASADGKPLKGILVKPDGFDPNQKWPLMVYFYEKTSTRLHGYSTPSPGTSPVSSYYVSNGYLWFQPDIIYDEGYPGPSAVKCIVSGVQHLINQGFVDETAIGAAGHSWGGYQTAFLVTRTNIFAAVESGAPVSNMISAYGGIRYGSGISRQFQYEMTQSRIGGSLWQYPMRYWENSPIFFADKVRTPVLILHNDNDGAVPWTNGIEFYMALRRLGQETYLFNYPGEEHGLRKRQNKKDWTRRMAEYFDHHLRGAPAPEWMKQGVPHAEREAEKLRYVADDYHEAWAGPKPKVETEAEPEPEAEAVLEFATSLPPAKAEAAPAAEGSGGRRR
ncbi:MAG: prolyl oligopeptidase family serine peptidase [Planctomycetota bacterium]